MNYETEIKLVVALLFAIAFTLIGWTAPVVYASEAPDSQFIEVHSFTAQDASPDDAQHVICFDRTVHRGTSGSIYTELYIVDNDTEQRYTVGGVESRYFQAGRHNVRSVANLPDSLDEGTYKYYLIAQLSLADGRVERTFVYESTVFNITRDVSTSIYERDLC